jgi:hypothetical protein
VSRSCGGESAARLDRIEWIGRYDWIYQIDGKST